jgi:hypothetical protein
VLLFAMVLDKAGEHLGLISVHTELAAEVAAQRRQGAGVLDADEAQQLAGVQLQGVSDALQHVRRRVGLLVVLQLDQVAVVDAGQALQVTQ